MRGANSDKVLPDKSKVERIFNIFHPYDPVAYRLEPIFHENYRHIRPLKLFSYNDAKHQYDTLSFECHKSYLKRKKKERVNGKLDGDPKLEKVEENESDSGDDCSSVHTACSSPRSQSPVGRRFAPPPHPPPPNFDSNRKSSTLTDVKEALPDSLLVGEAGELIEEIHVSKRIPMRIDYQVQPALTDKSYWSVLKSHFAYWTNLDVTAFVINALYLPPSMPHGHPTPTASTSVLDCG